MCYLLTFNICLLVMGIICFVKGKLSISHRWVATGAPAYLAGVVMLLPFPLTVITLVALMAIIGMQRQFWDVSDWVADYEFAFVILTFGITAVCLSLAFLIAMIWARDPAEIEAEERREEDWEEDDWD